MKTLLHDALGGLLAAGLLVAPAAAQWDDQQEQNQQQRTEEQRQRRQQQRRQQDQQGRPQDQRQRRQQDQGRRMQAQPSGWVAVAYDLDQDAYYDVVEYIYYYDLQQARQRSQQRARGERGQQARRDGRRRGQQVRVQGEITNLGIRGLSVSGADREHRFARIEIEQGRGVRVCLGPEQKVSELDLQEGDRITVEGVRARIDDRPVILARRVSTNGQSITNELPPREQWRRVNGEIAEVRRTREGQGRQEEHLVITLRRPDGRNLRVDLGPADEFEGMQLQQGDQISILARQGRIAGESLLIAQKVRTQGETIDVRESTARSLRGGDQQQRR